MANSGEKTHPLRFELTRCAPYCEVGAVVFLFAHQSDTGG